MMRDLIPRHPMNIRDSIRRIDELHAGWVELNRDIDPNAQAMAESGVTGWAVLRERVERVVASLPEEGWPETRFARELFTVDASHWETLLRWFARGGWIWRRRDGGMRRIYATRPEAFGTGRGRIGATPEAMVAATVNARLAPGLLTLVDAVRSDDWDAQISAADGLGKVAATLVAAGVAIAAVRRSLRHCDPVVMRKLAFHCPLFDERADEIEPEVTPKAPRARRGSTLPERVLAAVQRNPSGSVVSALCATVKDSAFKVKHILEQLEHDGLVTSRMEQREGRGARTARRFYPVHVEANGEEHTPAMAA